MWKPIDEAPKDGTWFLLRGRNMAGAIMIPVVVAWAPPGGDLSGQGWRDSGTFKDCDFLAATPGADWHPLPSPLTE